MFLLDTNVISELWKPLPDSQVVVWVNAQTIETLHLSAITVAEMRFGLATMPEGKRRTIHMERLERKILPAFAGRILPFDLVTSQTYAGLMAKAKATGKAISKEDGYIAATAFTHGLTVATRDVSPFKAAGLTVLNPRTGAAA